MRVCVCTFISTISIPFKLFLTPGNKTLSSALARTEKVHWLNSRQHKTQKRINEYVMYEYRNILQDRHERITNRTLKQRNCTIFKMDPDDSKNEMHCGLIGRWSNN